MSSLILHRILEYLILGTAWAALVEYLDSRNNSSKLKKSITARLVIVLAWPITLFIGIVSILRNLTNQK